MRLMLQNSFLPALLRVIKSSAVRWMVYVFAFNILVRLPQRKMPFDDYVSVR